MPWGRPMVGDTWKPRSVTSSCAGAPSSSAVVTPGSISRASASVLTPRASRAVASRTALCPVRPRAVSPVVGSRTPVTTTGARVAVSFGVEAAWWVGCWGPAGRRARLPPHVGRDVHVVPLGERPLLRRGLPLVLEPPELQAEDLRLGDLGEHLGEPRLLQLKPADRLAEHHPVLGVAHRLVVARHRGADRSPRDAVARLGEAHERGLEPARLR